MILETTQRGRTIFKREEVKLLDSGPTFFHFSVKQRDNIWIDVYYRKNKTGILEWSCNSVTKRRKNGSAKWGCVMRITDKTKPYCSHTLSCALLLKSMEIKNTSIAVKNE